MRPAAATWLWCGFGSLAVCRRLCSTRDAPRPSHTGAHRARRKRHARFLFVCSVAPPAIRAMACVCFHGRVLRLGRPLPPGFYHVFYRVLYAFFYSDHRQRVLNAFFF